LAELPVGAEIPDGRPTHPAHPSSTLCAINSASNYPLVSFPAQRLYSWVVRGLGLRLPQMAVVVARSLSGWDSDPFSKVTLNVADNYLDGVHTLTITNQDGQMAASKFPLLLRGRRRCLFP
jgi:hypothetical protein